MKNLYKLLALTVGVLSLSACEADRDSNPTLNEPDTFVLNVPPFAANNVYDLKNSQSIECRIGLYARLALVWCFGSCAAQHQPSND